MMLVEKTTVAASSLPVAQFREHLRLGSGFSDDGLQDGILEIYLRAAMAAIEARTQKVLLERELVWTVRDWRDGVEEALPFAPVSAITQITRVTRQSEEQVPPSGEWQLIPDLHRPLIVGTLPRIPQGGSLRISVLAGYGPEWSDVPPDLAQAVLLLAAHYYEFRHDMAASGGAMPHGVQALIERYRTVRLFLGRARA